MKKMLRSSRLDDEAAGDSNVYNPNKTPWRLGDEAGGDQTVYQTEKSTGLGEGYGKADDPLPGEED